jgi:hypothetical protein
MLTKPWQKAADRACTKSFCRWVWLWYRNQTKVSQENCRPTSLGNIDTKILNKIQANQACHIWKGLPSVAKWNLSQQCKKGHNMKIKIYAINRIYIKPIWFHRIEYLFNDVNTQQSRDKEKLCQSYKNHLWQNTRTYTCWLLSPWDQEDKNAPFLSIYR